MNALDMKLNYLVSKIEALNREEQELRQKQVMCGKEIAEFLNEHGCPQNAHPIHIIRHFRQKKVLETLK